jgi:hyperosmotically inducible protein
MKHQNVLRKIITPLQLLSIVLLSGSIALSADQAKGPVESAGRKIDKAGQKVAEYIDDSAISAVLKAEILKDPLTKNFEISVTTTKGMVDLSGIVDSQQVIDRALEIAKQNKNVSSVRNNLFVRRVK